MNDIEKAIGIAFHAHAGATDKGGLPYILHPLRLMLKLSTEDEMIVAILHDVVEDTDVTLASLSNAGFSEKIIFALDKLTKRKGESYTNFINRIASDELARKVKIEDLKDNLDTSRLNELTQNDLQRLAKYHAALKKLETHSE